MVWRENYYTCKENKIEIALQWNPNFSNNLTWESKFVLSIGAFRDRGKITVFGWRREVKFPSKHREFQNTESSRNWGSTVLYRSLWTTIKRDGLKNPSLAQQEVACTGHRISCRLFFKGSRLTHELQCSSPRRRNLDKWITGRYDLSCFTTLFWMRSHRNRIRISSWFLSMSFRFYIILYLSFARKKMYNFIAFSISNV